LILRCITKVTRRFTWVCTEDVREIAATLHVSLLANDRKKLRAFEPSHGTRFSTWIGLLAINAAHDHVRALAREPKREHITAAMDVVADVADPADVASGRERAIFLRQAFDQLTERDRTFAVLYFRERMEPRDIAREMNVSIKTVYSKKHKLLSRLQRAQLIH
jgi:RNA polymerase sigma-70 factor (ECF subfamily)